ncbi:hypothetical protein BDW02DRAFT_418891 [Decorospora gaudefroyi]|uniref:Uncharacterized protein n=1 Tax=Decorospora gaudefroyi TaxID=184978 RepID=A0A6A5K7I0_9PLEO|nr:hypothetical protein BDW02DRAFT_418891 [Decorospora gaudefroyi]
MRFQRLRACMRTSYRSDYTVHPAPRRLEPCPIVPCTSRIPILQLQRVWLEESKMLCFGSKASGHAPSSFSAAIPQVLRHEVVSALRAHRFTVPASRSNKYVVRSGVVSQSQCTCGCVETAPELRIHVHNMMRHAVRWSVRQIVPNTMFVVCWVGAYPAWPVGGSARSVPDLSVKRSMNRTKEQLVRTSQTHADSPTLKIRDSAPFAYTAS